MRKRNVPPRTTPPTNGANSGASRGAVDISPFDNIPTGLAKASSAYSSVSAKIKEKHKTVGKRRTKTRG
tara:strand:- start:253 stop:459 length:207 start_codon:yes stop_codon:yes gene_type:complete